MSVVYHNLSEIHRYEDEWRLRLKLLRSWKEYYDDGEVNCIQLLFVDEAGRRISATIPERLVERFEHLLDCENIWFTVSDVFVTYQHIDWVTGHKYHLHAYSKTSMNSTPALNNHHYMEFQPFHTIIEGTAPETLPVDIMGAIYRVGAIDYDESSLCGWRAKKVHFFMRDLEGVLLDGLAYGEVGEKLILDWEENKGTVRFCVLRFWFIGRHAGGMFHNREGISDIKYDIYQIPEMYTFMRKYVAKYYPVL